jgi:hypothetical protein
MDWEICEWRSNDLFQVYSGICLEKLRSEIWSHGLTIMGQNASHYTLKAGHDKQLLSNGIETCFLITRVF